MTIRSRSMSQAGLPYFRVTGGPFASPQAMGWHLTSEAGLTLGVANDSIVAQRLNDLEEFWEFWNSCNLEYHIRERRDQGYLRCDDEQWERFKELLKRMGK